LARSKTYLMLKAGPVHLRQYAPSRAGMLRAWGDCRLFQRGEAVAPSRACRLRAWGCCRLNHRKEAAASLYIYSVSVAVCWEQDFRVLYSVLECWIGVLECCVCYHQGPTTARHFCLQGFFALKSVHHMLHLAAALTSAPR
jgi:hypothetical protein